jgi:hypothetical protein
MDLETDEISYACASVSDLTDQNEKIQKLIKEINFVFATHYAQAEVNKLMSQEVI